MLHSALFLWLQLFIDHIFLTLCFRSIRWCIAEKQCW